MQILSAPSAMPRNPLRAGQALSSRCVDTPRATLAVATTGYLVPLAGFTGRVHSVFAQACNIEVADTLLTVCVPRAGNGPTTLRLADGTAGDLRDLFDAGEGVASRDGVASTGRTLLRLTGATVWRPADPGPSLASARIGNHLRAAGLRLGRRRSAHPSVFDGLAAAAVAAIGDACRALDGDQAARQAGRLIGWGEGLTPAGDDFLVGLLAGLDALVQGDGRRQRFRTALASALVSCMRRTTPIAAHYLRLAAGGHYIEPLVDLRNALLAEPDWQAVDMRLQRALDVGATSGADTVSGLLAGLAAWLPAASTETRT
jgi:hypothetical protein